MWVAYAVPSEDENFIGIPDKLFNECMEILEHKPALAPLTFIVRHNDKTALIGMTEFVPGNNLTIPKHIIDLLGVPIGEKVKINVFRQKPPVLRKLLLQPVDWRFYDQHDHVQKIEQSLQFFPTINKDSLLPIRFNQTIIHMKVAKLYSQIEAMYAIVDPHQEVQLDFEANDPLWEEYQQQMENRKRDQRMANMEKAWDCFRQGKLVFGMSNEMREYIRKKQILNPIVNHRR